VIVVNEIRTPERAEYLIKNGLADFVAIGKDLLSDPEWTKKAYENKEIIYCLNCRPKCKRYICGELCPRYKQEIKDDD
jgi:NADPH2 dehydrogenase